jgi:hypothetical protein
MVGRETEPRRKIEGGAGEELECNFQDVIELIWIVVSNESTPFCSQS